VVLAGWFDTDGMHVRVRPSVFTAEGNVVNDVLTSDTVTDPGDALRKLNQNVCLHELAAMCTLEIMLRRETKVASYANGS